MPETPNTNVQLARMTDVNQELFTKIIMARASTSAKQMEIKRREIAQMSATVELLVNQAVDLPPENPKSAQMLNTANVFGMICMMKSMEYVCDALSWRTTSKIKGTNEKAHSRLTVADLLNEIASAVDHPEEGGLLQNQEISLAMLNDIGIALKAFKDKHGVISDGKYAHVDAPVTEKEVEAAEAASESDEETPLEKLAKKAKDRHVK